MKTAIVFAGQGAQAPGMGRALYEQNEAARRVFDEATEVYRRVTGSARSMPEICFDLPTEELNLTANAQPAIFTLSMAGLAAIREAFEENTVMLIKASHYMNFGWLVDQLSE